MTASKSFFVGTALLITKLLIKQFILNKFKLTYILFKLDNLLKIEFKVKLLNYL